VAMACYCNFIFAIACVFLKLKAIVPSPDAAFPLLGCSPPF
jgi:hypothetical protein